MYKEMGPFFGYSRYCPQKGHRQQPGGRAPKDRPVTSVTSPVIAARAQAQQRDQAAGWQDSSLEDGPATRSAPTPGSFLSSLLGSVSATWWQCTGSQDKGNRSWQQSCRPRPQDRCPARGWLWCLDAQGQAQERLALFCQLTAASQSPHRHTQALLNWEPIYYSMPWLISTKIN